MIRDYWDAGVRHIVALRGDPPAASARATRRIRGGYRNAADLVAGIKRIGDFEVSVSAYPEKHPDSPSLDADIDMLKAKVDAGATPRDHPVLLRERPLFPLSRPRARARHRYPDRARHLAGAELQADEEFRRARGASVPDWLADRFEGLDDDPATRKLIAAAVAAEQVLDLVDRGVTDFHFYTMNRADLVYAICHLLGLRPRGEDAARVTHRQSVREQCAQVRCRDQPLNRRCAALARASASSCSTAPWAP